MLTTAPYLTHPQPRVWLQLRVRTGGAQAARRLTASPGRCLQHVNDVEQRALRVRFRGVHFHSFPRGGCCFQSCCAWAWAKPTRGRRQVLRHDVQCAQQCLPRQSVGALLPRCAKARQAYAPQRQLNRETSAAPPAAPPQPRHEPPRCCSRRQRCSRAGARVVTQHGPQRTQAYFCRRFQSYHFPTEFGEPRHPDGRAGEGAQHLRRHPWGTCRLGQRGYAQLAHNTPTVRTRKRAEQRQVRVVQGVRRAGAM